MTIFVGVILILLVIQILVRIVNFGSGEYPNNYKMTQEEAAWRLFFSLVLGVWAAALLFG